LLTLFGAKNPSILLAKWGGGGVFVGADYVYGVLLNENKLIVTLVWRRGPEAIFLVVCDPSVNVL
jgi:hypothetical protein